MLSWHVTPSSGRQSSWSAEVDDLDDAALRGDEELIRRLVAMRRRIARYRRVAGLHREVFADLARPDFLPELDERESRAIVDVDRATRAGVRGALQRRARCSSARSTFT